MGKLTISMASFNSFLYVYQRVTNWDFDQPKKLTQPRCRQIYHGSPGDLRAFYDGKKNCRTFDGGFDGKSLEVLLGKVAPLFYSH